VNDGRPRGDEPSVESVDAPAADGARTTKNAPPAADGATPNGAPAADGALPNGAPAADGALPNGTRAPLGAALALGLAAVASSLVQQFAASYALAASVGSFFVVYLVAERAGASWSSQPFDPEGRSSLARAALGGFGAVLVVTLVGWATGELGPRLTAPGVGQLAAGLREGFEAARGETLYRWLPFALVRSRVPRGGLLAFQAFAGVGPLLLTADLGAWALTAAVGLYCALLLEQSGRWAAAVAGHAAVRIGTSVLVPLLFEVRWRAGTWSPPERARGLPALLFAVTLTVAALVVLGAARRRLAPRSPGDNAALQNASPQLTQLSGRAAPGPLTVGYASRGRWPKSAADMTYPGRRPPLRQRRLRLPAQPRESRLSNVALRPLRGAHACSHPRRPAPGPARRGVTRRDKRRASPLTLGGRGRARPAPSTRHQNGNGDDETDQNQPPQHHAAHNRLKPSPEDLANGLPQQAEELPNDLAHERNPSARAPATLVNFCKGAALESPSEAPCRSPPQRSFELSPNERHPLARAQRRA
jgi:hypothetical protein